jgi:hypothetical protein
MLKLMDIETEEERMQNFANARLAFFEDRFSKSTPTVTGSTREDELNSSNKKERKPKVCETEARQIAFEKYSYLQYLRCDCGLKCVESTTHAETRFLREKIGIIPDNQMIYCQPTSLNRSDLFLKKLGINTVLNEALVKNANGSSFDFSIRDPFESKIRRKVCETGLLMVAGLQFEKGKF